MSEVTGGRRSMPILKLLLGQWPPVVPIRAAFVHTDLPIVIKGRPHPELWPSVRDVAPVPRTTMALDQGAISH